jgi:hypothetical protein
LPFDLISVEAQSKTTRGRVDLRDAASRVRLALACLESKSKRRVGALAAPEMSFPISEKRRKFVCLGFVKRGCVRCAAVNETKE